MSGHTPGKWSIENNESCAVICAEGMSIAAVWPTSLGQPQQLPIEANARLIAAAPELLDALRGMIVSYELEASPLNPALLKARAALAKATGGAE